MTLRSRGLKQNVGRPPASRITAHCQGTSAWNPRRSKKKFLRRSSWSDTAHFVIWRMETDFGGGVLRKLSGDGLRQAVAEGTSDARMFKLRRRRTSLHGRWVHYAVAQKR